MKNFGQLLFKGFLMLSFSFRGSYSSSSTITNNQVWYDDNDMPIKANRGGYINPKKINGFWYWVGSEAHSEWGKGGDVYLYKSDSLGSDSWKMVRKIVDIVPGQATTSSCSMQQKNENTFVIHCRKKVYVSTNGVEGNYSKLTPLKIPVKVNPYGKLKVGSSSTFEDDGDLYFVTTRLQKKVPGKNGYRRRFAYIYKLSSDWETVDESEKEISWLWDGFEAPYIVKKDDWYYIFSSGCQGWRQSFARYRRAKKLKDLKNAKDEFVAMNPNPYGVHSMKSQFNFFAEFEEGKWLFGGRRHPDEDPKSWEPSKGKFIIVPATFQNGTPNVHWKLAFDWKTYDYDNPHNDPFSY